LRLAGLLKHYKQETTEFSLGRLYRVASQLLGAPLLYFHKLISKLISRDESFCFINSWQPKKMKGKKNETMQCRLI